MTRNFKIIGFLTVFLLGLVVLALKYNYIGNGLQEKLQKMCTDGDLISLHQLLDSRSGKVCIVYPYGNSVIGNSEDVLRINAHLEKLGYEAGEGTWALVLLNDDNNISLLEFARKPDVLSDYELSKFNNIILPAWFVPLECTDIKDGYFYQLKIQNENYIILGGKKTH